LTTRGLCLVHNFGEEPLPGSGSCSCSDPMLALDPVLSSYKKMAAWFSVRRTDVPIERRQERAPEAPYRKLRGINGRGPRVWRGGCPFMPQVLKNLHAQRAPAIDPVAKIERSGGG
jgi:hypothetical protein